MYLLRPKSILRKQAVIIAANVEHDAVAAIAQQIGRAKRALNIRWRVLVRVSQRRKPQRKGTLTAGVTGRVVLHSLAFNQVYLHAGTPKVSLKFA